MDKDNIPFKEFYTPTYMPWKKPGKFQNVFNKAFPRSLVSKPRMWVLWCLSRSTAALAGEMWECGVYKGGTAFLLTRAVPHKELRLFDTFEGLPMVDEKEDLHLEGDFSDTSVEGVKKFIGKGKISVHKGLIPETFKGLEDKKLAFVHVDVDLYQSVLDCCRFVWPRLQVGGVVIFDDYGFPTCPGARSAVDEFFEETKAVPLCLQTGQAMVMKSMEEE